ncbi:MAG: prolyl oligopeptidase family serine peptidase [Verrucomicrobia bacterium]|nr:prolyl oligopeptidase family serine peptidase [Verrucomicrobiota bacterium]
MTNRWFGLGVLVVVISFSLPESLLGAVYKSRVNAQWSADNTHFWYRNDLSGRSREFVLVNLGKGTRKEAFDHGRVAKALEEAGAGGVEADQLPLDQLGFDLAKGLAFFRVKGSHFQLELKTHKLTKLEKAEEVPGYRMSEDNRSERKRDRYRGYQAKRDVSPDGKWRAYIHEYNVYVRATEGDEKIRLSKDGKKDNAYQAPYWAPNSNNLIAYRIEPSKISEVHLLESSPKGGGKAKLHTRRYALPGDKFTSHELNWFDVEKKLHVKPDVGVIDFHWPNMRWSMDGRTFTYRKVDRGHQRFRIIEVDTFTGKARNIIDEVSETFIWTDHGKDYGVSRVTWLKKKKEIIYISEQDGWRHLYLVDVATGKQKQITKGEYVLRYVDKIDEEKRQVWFRASGRNPKQDPYLIHYYRINFDGGGLTALTEGDGTHEVRYSPDRKYLIDTYSRIDMAPVNELRRVSDGGLVCKLEESDISQLKASGWDAPEVFSAKGRDGETGIWGFICRPKDYDPKKKYPVLESMYAGPHDSYVPKGFSSSSRYASWTDMGFVVVKIDGMGTANRSKAFHDVCWKNLKDAGFPDRILWHKAVAKKYPWYDTSRVGIYGGSAGGQSSTGALLFHPEFYKVAVSACGCHDNRMDKASWNEQWMGYPVGPHYSASSNIDNAHRLQGKLMLIVGELDKNVPPESTFRLADALIRANREFELVVIPGGGHGDGGRYGDRKRKDFFRKHLQGIDSPNRNVVESSLRTETLKWTEIAEGAPPRSLDGSATEIHFLNSMKKGVKIYWVNFGGGLKLYGKLAPGETRNQNTYSDAVWLVTDEEEKSLGYFRATRTVGKAVIPNR